MISLRALLNEILEPLEVDEAVMDDAKRQGLEYFGFGRYGKDGHVTHKSANGKLVPVATKTGTTTPSKKPRTASQKAADAYARSKGDLNRRLRANDKLRNAERAKDPDYQEKLDKRPGGRSGGGGESRSDVVGYDTTDLGLGGARSVYRGELKPRFGGVAPNRPLTPADYDAPMPQPRQSVTPKPKDKVTQTTVPTFTSKKTGKTYAWKRNTPGDIAPALPGMSPDDGEWLDAVGKGTYGKNGVATHKEYKGNLVPITPAKKQ
jgi:hypothetical protein